jgi:membrane protease YdiL (CAAX protease family)
MIGRAFQSDRRRGAIALAVALALIALQFQVLLERPWAPGQGGTHLIVVLGAVLALWWLAGRDFETLGLRTRVEPSWRFWVGAGVAIGLAVGVIVAGYVLVSGRYHDLWFGLPDADTWRVRLPDACIFAPVYEELAYRAALCSTLLPYLGRWPTIFVSGAIFAAVHFAYGTAGPDNFVAGYFFAWAYLRSGSVAVPMALHASGNLLAILLQPHMG